MGRTKNDNRGSGIVSVIITIAFIGALSTALLFMTYMNYQMKISSRAAQRTFYSAEATLDQVRAAMQVIVSDSIRDSYAKTLLDYSNLVSESDFSRAQTAFSQNFIVELAERVGISAMPAADMAAGDYAFEIGTLLDRICSYTSFTVAEAANPELHGLSIRATDSSSGQGTARLTLVAGETTPKFIELRGFQVRRIVEGYETTLNTDFTIHCPPFVAVAAGYQSRLDSYIIVADGTVKTAMLSDTALNGNVFAGELDVSGVDHIFTMNSGRVISPGTYKVHGGATLIIGDSASIWAARITVDSTVQPSFLDLRGNIQVADDLELVAKGGSASLSGSYFGFGAGSTGLSSSAILISGQNSTLDLQGLSSLGLAGRSYIAGNPDGSGGIPTAGSLSIKSDQIAYLVPDACITRFSGGVGTALPNPSIAPTGDDLPVYTYTPGPGGSPGTYALLIGEGSITPEDEDEYILIERSGALLDYNAMPTRRMHVVSGNPAQTMLYFFLTFGNDRDREDYFSQYFTNHGDRMDDYLRIYFDQTSNPGDINPDGGVSAAGFVYEFAAGSDSYQLRSPVSSGPVEAMAKTYAKQYESLTATLFEMEVPADNTITPFTRYIDTEKISNELDSNAVVPFRDDAGEVRAVILTATTGSYTLNNLGARENINLVISMGCDVTIACDFKGLVISRGHVDINTSALSKDSLLLSEALGAVDGDGNPILRYLRGTSSAVPKAGDDASTWNLDDLVAFSNWKKNEPNAD